MRLRHPRRGALALAVAAALVPLAPAPAPAMEVTPRPATGSLTLTGHGYGHGRGMSQWGAYGAAKVAGLSYQQILDFYYPGTARHILADDTIRVALSDNDGDTVLAPTTGLAVVTGGRRTELPAGADYTRWRATGSSAVTLEYRDSAGTWRPYGAVSAATDLAFTAPGTLRVQLPSGVWEELRGDVHATLVSGRTRTVLHTPMETYLRGVVPNEMPASWHGQALAAQSVAARTYAAAYRQRQRANGSWYDICDTTSCQVFSGVATYSGAARTPREDSRSDAAIAATKGVVLRTSSSTAAPLVNTEFSSSNGGWTAAGGYSYQVAKADPYDAMAGNSNATWTDTVDPADLDGVKGIGRFTRLVVLERDGHGDLGGRILRARLEGSEGTAEVTGDQLRGLLGVKSSWFAIGGAKASATADYDGDGRADILAREPGGNLVLYPGTGSDFGEGRVVGTGWSGMREVFGVGDFDGSGTADIIGRTTADTLWFYGSDGRGGWAVEKQIGKGWGAYRNLLSTGDWNGDGRPDVLAINKTTQQLVISYGRGSYLDDAKAIGVNWGGVDKLIGAGDLDGDGKADLLGRTTTGDLWLYVGDGAGRVASQRQVGHGWSAMTSVWSIGDVDGDGRVDLLGIDGAGTLRVYPGDGAGGFGDARVLGTGWQGRTPVG